jgi:hypothetical protein
MLRAIPNDLNNFCVTKAAVSVNRQASTLIAGAKLMTFGAKDVPLDNWARHVPVWLAQGPVFPVWPNVQLPARRPPLHRAMPARSFRD